MDGSAAVGGPEGNVNGQIGARLHTLDDGHSRRDHTRHRHLPDSSSLLEDLYVDVYKCMNGAA